MGDPHGWLARRNPTVKLALLFGCSVVTLFLLDPVTLAALYALGAAAVLATTDLGVRRLLAAQVPFVAFGAGLVLVNAFSRPGTLLAPGLPLRVTVEGVTVGVALALRTLVIGVLSTGFVVSTTPQRLLTSLVQQARLSARAAYAVLAGYRLLHLLPQHWQTIRDAHAVRAPLDRRGRPALGPRVFVRSAFTLLVVSIRAGERIALALESRGLGTGPRTTWRPVALDRQDAWCVLAVVAAVALVLAVGVLA
ncbi:energy-coupling factor transport system permease protein/energy-coupling factor transport system ATP-binding protein [Microlunatus flavus]|uniref:Energy-coupling factor transport system permease protein/energy-coupling factor transport system ATP-binding protein n=1 Tax=Microlunatus flavus TaxID=1036181 RepID=A0A1H9A5B5_9ACTN|nr:energy-coupling factor transport system permease protein/energy-coupling factor transport system ATP-binding protein [Microlunatus flavus]